jgi:predicted TPR repeat methyltransferase
MKKSKKFVSKSLRPGRSHQNPTRTLAPPDNFVSEMVSLFQAGELDRFEKKALEAVRRWPNNFIGWKALGDLYLFQGRLETSYEYLVKCVQLAPDDPQAHNNLGNVCVSLGRLEDAEVYFRKALMLEPNYAQAHNDLGAVHFKLGRYEEAQASFQRALELKPDFAQAYNNLGNIYKAERNFMKAKENYLKALSLNPDLPLANLNMGLILDQNFSEKNEAHQYYRKAVLLDPDNAEIHQSYGNFLVKYDSLEGIQHLERARHLNPEQEHLLGQLGYAYLQLGKKKEAISCLKIALQQDADDAIAKYFLSVAEGRLPDSATRADYVENLFDAYSSNFDNDLAEKLEYEVPRVARDIIEKIFGKNIRFQEMADLGCGTGLSGIAFRDCVDNIVGIDLSRKMLDKAAEKGVYDALLQGEITEVLHKLEQRFDFILATDVVVYFQGLDVLFSLIKEKAANGALFVFSTEWHPGNGFEVNEKSGRTAHSSEYIHALARNLNFHTLESIRIPLRKDKEGWAEGELFILQCQNCE